MSARLVLVKQEQQAQDEFTKMTDNAGAGSKSFGV